MAKAKKDQTDVERLTEQFDELREQQAQLRREWDDLRERREAAKRQADEVEQQLIEARKAAAERQADAEAVTVEAEPAKMKARSGRG